MEVTKWLEPSGSVSRIGEPRLPLWVNKRPTAPPSQASAPGGTAEEIGMKADIAAGRAAFDPYLTVTEGAPPLSSNRRARWPGPLEDLKPPPVR